MNTKLYYTYDTAQNRLLQKTGAATGYMHPANRSNRAIDELLYNNMSPAQQPPPPSVRIVVHPIKWDFNNQ